MDTLPKSIKDNVSESTKAFVSAIVRLEKENAELKLRIQYLENKLILNGHDEV